MNLYLFRGITKTITKPPLQLLFGDRSFAKINLWAIALLCLKTYQN
ncbi:MAG: hypothetical protein HXY43_03800 [Fischerella sp.]|nr:hypothetical protein [Fischerella sp.]NWF58442.1 hypothetical protein [Fischerella sp.]